MASDLAVLLDRSAGELLRRPLDPEVAANVAEFALDHGREADALGPVRETARCAGSASLWQWTALLYRALDRREEALDALQWAASFAPNDARVAHGTARTKLEAGLPALAAFDRALALSPHDGEILLGRAAAQCAAGDASRAARELEATLALSPLWIAGHETAARIRWALGDREGFTSSLERALLAKPQNVALWRSLLILLIHADRFEAALAAAARARREIGDHIVVLANEAAAYSELGKVAEADAVYRRIEPSSAIRHVRHLLRTGRPQQAAVRCESLLGGPEEALAWPYLGLAWRITDDPRWAWFEGDASFVGVFDLADRLPPLDRLAAHLRSLHTARHQPLDQSLRGGTQTDGGLFERIDPDIQAARSVIADTVRTYLDQLPMIDARHPLLRHRRDGAVRFAGSWSVRLTDAGFHANHMHPAGWLSSALYVALPTPRPGEATNAGWLTLGAPQAELGLSLPPLREIAPRPGRLVLFPSTMWHGTRPFSAGERMTIAFDVAHPRP